MSNENQQKLLENEQKSHSLLDAARKENKEREDRWANELETLRQQKDSRIRALEREKEDQRNVYELKINDLDSKLKSKYIHCSYVCRTNPEGLGALKQHHRIEGAPYPEA